MKVTIPSKTEHAGSPTNLITVEIADKCPICGGNRGTKRWKGFSYDGSRRLGVDCWENPCGHVDTYFLVRNEVVNQIKQHETDSDTF